MTGVMLPVSQQAVYTLMALRRYHDALVQHRGPERPLVYQPLIPQILTVCYHIVLLPPRAFDAHPPVTRDVYHAVAFCSCAQQPRTHLRGTDKHPPPHASAGRAGTFAELFADIGARGCSLCAG